MGPAERSARINDLRAAIASNNRTSPNLEVHAILQQELDQHLAFVESQKDPSKRAMHMEQEAQRYRNHAAYLARRVEEVARQREHTLALLQNHDKAIEDHRAEIAHVKQAADAAAAKARALRDQAQRQQTQCSQQLAGDDFIQQFVREVRADPTAILRIQEELQRIMDSAKLEPPADDVPPTQLDPGTTQQPRQRTPDPTDTEPQGPANAHRERSPRSRSPCRRHRSKSAAPQHREARSMPPIGKEEQSQATD